MYSMAIPRASQLRESRKRSHAGSELENNDSVDVNSVKPPKKQRKVGYKFRQDPSLAH